MSSGNEKTNEKMARVAPELASEFARYPLKRKMWVAPTGKTAKGEPCFIVGDEGSNGGLMKIDYVYGRGVLGLGYYHLLTRDAHAILYKRLFNEAPVCCCTCSPSFALVPRAQVSDHDDVVIICYNRSVASIPDDEQAAKDAYNISRGTAKAHYQFQQNEQLIVGAITTGVVLNTAG
eukprot:CAMPEP_0181033432 /NCGR_PEP_ID=MMETSP1070-20121207/7251_1 /TAXON_ID=265543 /ORGANISM="Minutocellus polymorphus, Strain NH13" /LENGTH=176 /DNA_ID=CAMNT_0023110853 /DNA_START=145 /DNA_END=675 /DNA_ORIENTATION=+